MPLLIHKQNGSKQTMSAEEYKNLNPNIKEMYRVASSTPPEAKSEGATPVKDIARKISTLDSEEEIMNLVANDSRAGVKKAADARIKELNK